MAAGFRWVVDEVTSSWMADIQAIRRRWELDGSKRDELGRRLFAASETRVAGWGGLAGVAEVTGLARSTILRGLKDLDAPRLEPGQVRRRGGGPWPLSKRDVTLLADLERIVKPATLGDPERALFWVSKSADKIATSLEEEGHQASSSTVPKLLAEIGYSRATPIARLWKPPTILTATPSLNTSILKF